MSWKESRVWHRLKRNGTEIVPTGGISTSESLSSLTTTSTIAPAARPSLSANDEIKIEWIDLELGITRVQFFGTIADVDTESEPQATTVPAQGPLANLRFERRSGSGDLNLTGMTDTEVIQAVLTYCEIDFDSGDIHGAGYVLGERADLFWRVGEPGSDIVGELDDVLGYKTFEIGEGRIIRRYYDLAPTTATGVYRTYTKGRSRDLWSLHRRLGRPDAIQNSFLVKGVTVDCGPDDSCQCTPWAKARDVNPHTGSRRQRVPIREYQSDIIQDEGIARWKARQLMRNGNRLLKEFAIGALNDVNIHQTTKLKIIDSTPLVDCGSGCYGTVTAVERTGPEMAVTMVGGDPGEEGTITSSVEMICNDVEREEDFPGDELDPDVGFPPFDPGDDFDDDFPTGGEETPPDPSEPFMDCTENSSLICPDDIEDPDTCQEATITAYDCLLFGIDAPPEDVCKSEGWHKSIWSATDDATYICSCKIETNLLHMATNSFANYYTNADAEVEKVTACMYEGDTFLVGIDFTIGNEVKFDRHFSDEDIPGDNLNQKIVNASQLYTGDFCLEFDYRFCNHGDSIHMFGAISDEEGEYHVLSDHAFTLYAVPGEEVQVGFSPDKFINVNSAVTHLDTPVLVGDAGPHTSFGLNNRNNGGYSLGSGLPLNRDLHASICFKMSGDSPPAYWDNGVDSGYIEHLPYIDEEHPSPGEPTIRTEETTHIAHLVQFALIPGTNSLCTDDCPGPQVWGMITGSETCADNPDFVPSEGD